MPSRARRDLFPAREETCETRRDVRRGCSRAVTSLYVHVILNLLLIAVCELEAKLWYPIMVFYIYE